MKIKLDKRALAIALALVTGWTLIAQTEAPKTSRPVNDQVFVDLITEAQGLDEKADSYNDHCGQGQTEEACAIVAGILKTEEKAWIAKASLYHPEGIGCLPDERAKLVNWLARQFAWNIKYGGAPKSEEAVKEQQALMDEFAKLRESVNQCVSVPEKA